MKPTANDAAKAAALTAGVKFDEGKARFDLLPPDALNEAARVFTMGAAKYADRNWEKGMDWGRVYAATHRHLGAFWGGEQVDPESGMLHTAHATFGTLVLTAYQMRNVGNDSRHELLPVARPKLNLTGAAKHVGDKVTLSKHDFEVLMTAAGQRA